MNFKHFFVEALEQYGLTLSEKQLLSFTHYFELLVEWNDKINLTAITDPQEVAVKHMIDSLSCYDESLFPVGASLVDVGTGAGFPGLPLKIIRPDIKLTLLDSVNKRLIFLQAVLDKLEISSVKLIHARAEDAGHKEKLRGQFHIATSRAVARLNILCELCMPLVMIGGYFIALKGAQYKQEIDEAQQAIKLLGGEISSVKIIKLPGLEDTRAVIYIKKIGATSTSYPRRPGMLEKKPL